GCQPQSPTTGDAPTATPGNTTAVAQAAGCDGNTKPVFVPDNSDNAIVKGGSQGNVKPSNQELAAYVRGYGIEPGIIDSMMPKGDLQPAVLCPSGEIFTNGEKVANTDTNLFTRNP